MAQTNNNETQNLNNNLNNNLTTSDTYGYYQWCNFGKWKGYSFYDIANEKDYGYLKKLIYSQQNPKINPKTGKTFHISNESMQHIHCALRSEVDGGTWNQEYKPVYGVNGVEDLNTSLLVYITETGLTSPSILYKKCINCENYKNNKMFTGTGNNNNKCNTCTKLITETSNSLYTSQSLPVLASNNLITQPHINPNIFMKLFKQFVPAEEIEKMQCLNK